MLCVCVDCGAETPVITGGEEEGSHGHASPVHRGPDSEILKLVGAGNGREHSIDHAFSCPLPHLLLYTLGDRSVNIIIVSNLRTHFAID